MNRKEVEQNTILLALSGSRAYGVNNENSDWDYKGICIAPLKYYLGFHKFEQKDAGWDTEYSPYFNYLTKDTVIYELKKYINLLVNNNPNILELLFMDEYLYLSPPAQFLIENRQKFLTRKVLKSYLGYAYSQIKRVETHRNWLLNPPISEPNPSDFGLKENTLASKDEVNRFTEFLWLCVKDRIEFLQPVENLHRLLFEDIDYKAIFRTYELLPDVMGVVQDYTQIPEDYLKYINQSLQYRNAVKHWQNYQNWLVTRNPERAEIERKCGMDGKHVSHCIRLLKQAKEIVENKTLIVNRKIAGDAEFLKSIRNGEKSYEETMPYVQELFDSVRNLECDLPKQVDYDFVSNLMRWMIEEHNAEKTK